MISFSGGWELAGIDDVAESELESEASRRRSDSGLCAWVDLDEELTPSETGWAVSNEMAAGGAVEIVSDEVKDDDDL